MAACENHPDAEAALIIGNTSTGEQLWLCGPCSARFGLDMACAVLPLEEVMQQVIQAFPQLADAPNGAEAPKRGRKRKASEAPQPESESPPAEAVEASPAATDNAADSSV